MEGIKITTPNTTAEIEVMKGNNGKPIKIENLPSPDFPAPPYLDHTQYRSVIIKHEAEDKQFEYSGTNGFTAKLEAAAPAGRLDARSRTPFPSTLPQGMLQRQPY